jgi:hypothetical protein
LEFADFHQTASLQSETQFPTKGMSWKASTCRRPAKTVTVNLEDPNQVVNLFYCFPDEAA